MTNETLWFYCPCWYCRFIHHPICGLLKWMDKAWLSIHEKMVKEASDDQYTRRDMTKTGKVCKKCQKKKEFTGSGLCSNTTIGCDMNCERCIYNKPCEHFRSKNR